MTIYFIRAGNEGAIKIGYTAGLAESRMAQLQTGSADQLSLIGTMPGSLKDEKALHREFAKYALSGEWFSASSELVKTIEYLIETQGPWFLCREIRRRFSFDKLENEWREAFSKSGADRSAHADFQVKSLEEGYDVVMRARMNAITLKKNQAFDRIKAHKEKYKSNPPWRSGILKTVMQNEDRCKRDPSYAVMLYLDAWNGKG